MGSVCFYCLKCLFYWWFQLSEAMASLFLFLIRQQKSPPWSEPSEKYFAAPISEANFENHIYVAFQRQAKLSEKPVLKDYRLSFRVIQICKVAHHFQLYCNVFTVSWDFQWNTAPRTQVYNSFLFHPKSYCKENPECKQANKQGQKKTQIIAKTYYFNK